MVGEPDDTCTSTHDMASGRQGRGRLLGAAALGPIATREVPLAAGWPDDPARAHRIAAGLVEDGLAVRDRSGNLRLP